MHEFMEILRSGEVKKRMLGNISSAWSGIEHELDEYEREQSQLIDECEQKLFDYYKMGKRMKSNFQSIIAFF